MSAPRKHPNELRERAMRMTVRSRHDPSTRPGMFRRVGEQLWVSPETLRNWTAQAEVDEELDVSHGGVRPPTGSIVEYIDQYRHRFGVESISWTLTAAGMPIAPSTHCAFKAHPSSKQALRDAESLVESGRVWAASFGGYGARMAHAELRRELIEVARCTVEQLTRVAGLRGVRRPKGPRTRIPGQGLDSRQDMVERGFAITSPGQLWAADITYCGTFRRLDVRRVHHRRGRASLFKAELARNIGPWNNIDDLEIAATECVDWFNRRRLHGEIGMIPPFELEYTCHHSPSAPATADVALASL